jgi:2-pyrone-4,6-dicarboxylate lactonase
MTRPCLLPLLQRTALQFQAPVGACDSHAHVFGPFARHPLADDRSYTPAGSTAHLSSRTWINSA